MLGALGAVVLGMLTGGVWVYFHVSSRDSGKRGRETLALQFVWRRIRWLRRKWFGMWKKDDSKDADGDTEMGALRQ